MLWLILEASIRSALIAAAIALILRALRVRQAAVRHRVWTGVLSLMLLLPAWLALGWRTTVPLLPPEAWQHAALTRIAAPPTTVAPSESSAIPQARAAGVNPDWPTVLFAIYFAGAALFLARLGLGTVQVVLLLRNARPVRGKLAHPACATPVTVGWWRPVVILPQDWPRWPEPQRAAIVAHEQEHVRRRDPLVQWFALLNRAVFWFHPLAWWLDRELSTLAEEACDEAVLSRGFEPRAYAGYLLSLARAVADAGARVNVLGMAASGAALPRRVRKIFLGSQSPSITRGKFAAVALACAAVAAAFTISSLAHAQPAAPAFDAATIKPNKSGERGGGSRFAGASYIGTNVTLKRVIALAYSPVQEFAGGPGWIESEHFDINAKAEGTPNRQQLQLMLRSLLADRFKLVVHKETRDAPAFALVLARADGKLGPALHPSTTDCSAGGCGFRIGDGALAGRGRTMENLAAELIFSGRLVVDRTGLTGLFDMDVKWTPDDLGANADFFTAIREQLGLKLEPIRAPVEFIVIDSASKPSEN